MNRQPRKRSDKIINKWIFIRYVIIGIYVGLATVGIFMYYYLMYQVPGH